MHKCCELRHIEAAGLSLLHLLCIEPDAETPFCPAAGAAQAKIGREEPGSFREVDPLDRVATLLLQEFCHIAAADPLQIAVIDRGLPTGVGKRRQRRPIPFTLVLVRREIFLYRLKNLGLRMPDRLIDSQPLGLLRSEAAVVGGAEFAGELA